MQFLLLFIILLYFVSIIYYSYNEKKILKKYIKRKEKEVDKAIAEKIRQREDLDWELEQRQFKIELAETQLADIDTQRQWVHEQLDIYQNEQRQIIDSQLEEIKQQKIENFELQLTKEMDDRRTQVENDYMTYLMNIKSQRESAEAELAKIKAGVEDFRAKQETINQEILRRRELEERSDFYRVCLTNEAISDIKLLQATRQNLKKPEILDKLIYDNYVAKPVLEMIKRVLQNSTCSGIYKITCQKTKEIYIGKSTDIKNRWQQHCKTAFNCGTIASSLLHKKMQQYGIENFTFELLEVVSKDQLSEREKFYINFYKTKEVGLNERNG